jgi:hypothetical protein
MKIIKITKIKKTNRVNESYFSNSVVFEIFSPFLRGRVWKKQGREVKKRKKTKAKK